MSPQSQRSSRAPVVLGLLLAAAGVFPILGGLGIVPVKPNPGTPGWVVVCTGLAFVLAGAGVAIGRAPADGHRARPTPFVVQLMHYVLGLGVAGLMTVIIGWVAFGPGERQFSGTVSLPFLSERWAGGETSGRIAFGVVAVLMLAIFGALAITGAQRLRGKRPRAR